MTHACHRFVTSVLISAALGVIGCAAVQKPAELLRLETLTRDSQALDKAKRTAPKIFEEGKGYQALALEALEDDELDDCSTYAELAWVKLETALEQARTQEAEARLKSASQRLSAAQEISAKQQARLDSMQKGVGRLEKIQTLETQLGEVSKRPSSADQFLAQQDALFQLASALSGVEVKKDKRGIVVILRQLFARKQILLLPGMLPLLDKIGELANRFPSTTLMLEGYTDSRGRHTDNLTLSMSRAQSVMDYLVQRHELPLNRIKASGYGETRPVSDNATPSGRVRNQRIEILFLFR